jgi:hypothetical protein
MKPKIILYLLSEKISMSRTFIGLLFLACIIGSVSADCKGDISKLLPIAVKLLADASADNTAQFEKDLLAAVPALQQVGKSCKGITPSSSCSSDITKINPYVNKIIEDIAADNESQLQKDCTTAAPYLDTAIKDCTGFVVSSTCSADLLKTIYPGSKVIDDIRTDQTKNLQADILSYLPYARTAWQDCTGNKIGDTCQTSINTVVPYIVKIINDLLAGNYSALISDGQNAIPKINSMLESCLGHGPSATCQGDLIGLLPILLAVFGDIKAKNWTQFEKDVTAAQPQIDAAWQACVGDQMIIA